MEGWTKILGNLATALASGDGLDSGSK